MVDMMQDGMKTDELILLFHEFENFEEWRCYGRDDFGMHRGARSRREDKR